MQLIPRQGGYVLAVKVVPGATRNRVAGTYGDGIRVTVSAPPEQGAANDRVIQVLADALEIPKKDVQIIHGQTSPRKTVLILGLVPEQIERRLNRT